MEKRYQEAFRGYYRSSQEQKQQVFVQVARENEADVARILQPGQLQRLQQIALQARGPSVFLETDMATELKLTAQQREQIRAIETSVCFGKADCHAPEASQPGLPKQIPEQALKSGLNQAIALLTPEQAKRWKELTGRPFVGLTPRFRPGQHRHFPPSPE
jgi:hypothetical protein